ncbi:spore coat associated protein CotJA [Aquibacillus koreensis]|uniref:Spore coat associated protein CotJA n=1 Tax=Aquibacillus koreensis TaxID=279446 RepID=A0A9X3WH20_9BACI|nr:spore coat associated protein CotJA [Aquibacillus koreensis]MCT2537412.1 spore coat associated protein CotJA [Aquibacillus koreensis]MDC3418858.1 spore coat associated protein CotJA [Aquibacillus koreensis]
MEHTYTKYYYPYISPLDPCKPIIKKSYSTPPNLYLGFQPPNLPQYNTAKEALYKGTLWPALYDNYKKYSLRGDES